MVRYDPGPTGGLGSRSLQVIHSVTRSIQRNKTCPSLLECLQLDSVSKSMLCSLYGHLPPSDSKLGQDCLFATDRKSVV